MRSNLTAFFTQRTEFKSGLWALRPGALLTLTIDGEEYPLLFLHTKSGVEPLGLGLRDDMLNRALDFKKVLEAVAGEVPNYMFLGDLNTMGMQYKYLRERDIAADLEVLKAAKFAEGRGMRLLVKDEPATWWNGGTSLAPSNLDQVVAVEHMAFKDFNGAEVTVLGWPKEPTPSTQRRVDRRLLRSRLSLHGGPEDLAVCLVQGPADIPFVVVGVVSIAASDI